MTTRPYRNPQFNLRIPEDLKTMIQDASSKSDRSMNAEIVARLRDSFNSYENNQESTEEIARRVAREEINKALKQP